MLADRPISVLVTMRFEPDLLDRLRAVSPRLRIESVASKNVTDDQWRSAEVLYTFAALPRPAQAPAVRWVQLHSAGVEHLFGKPLFDADVAFTTASGAHAIPIAEYVFAQLLALGRRLPTQLEWQRKGAFPPDQERWPLFVSDELWGRTIGIVGYGSIGRQVARIARAFGMRVLGMQRGSDHRDRGFVVPGSGDPEGVLPERYFPPDRLREMLAESDVVLLAVPLTDRTRSLVDEQALRAMKANAVLVNIARGGVCDEDALVRALREHWIGAAVLDVFEEEPLPEGHPLWTLENVLISPHTSAFSPHYDERVAALFAENLRRYLAGEPLVNLVDKQRRY